MKELNDIRTSLIKAVQQHATFWDASARSAALDAVRSDNPESLQRAKLSLARSDACDDYKTKVIDEIHCAFAAIERLMKAAKAAGGEE